jgi:hypothetical protein
MRRRACVGVLAVFASAFVRVVNLAEVGSSGACSSGGSVTGGSGKRRLGAATGDEFMVCLCEKDRETERQRDRETDFTRAARRNDSHVGSVQIAQPEPLPHPCEMLPHQYPHRKHEHGDNPLLRDSEDESEYMHHKRQNGGEEPDVTPGWAKHLRLKLRIAQKGHVGAIAPTALDVAGLQASWIYNCGCRLILTNFPSSHHAWPWRGPWPCPRTVGWLALTSTGIGSIIREKRKRTRERCGTEFAGGW